MEKDKQDQRKTMMLNEPLPKVISKMAVPSIVAFLITSIYNLADTFFVSSLGTNATAAVSVNASLDQIIMMAGSMLAVGAASYISRLLGAKKDEKASRVLSTAFFLALGFGGAVMILGSVFMTPMVRLLGATDTCEQYAVEYATYVLLVAPFMATTFVMNQCLRSEGSALFSMFGMGFGGILNCVLDPIFILPWGLNMGAAGAGLATFLSNCAACLYFFVLLFVRRGRTYVCIQPAMARPRKELVKGVLGVGVPASIQNLLNVTGMTVLNNFTAVFGPDAIAAMGIAYKINMIPMYIAMGVSQGLMPLVSYNYGSGNVPRLKKAVLFAEKISLSFMVTVSVCYFFASGPLIGLFMKTGAVVAYGARFLRCMCVAQPFLCLDFLAVGVFQAVGSGKRAFFFAILRKIIMEIPALYILNALFPLYGLAYAQMITEIILAVTAMLVLRRMFKSLAS